MPAPFTLFKRSLRGRDRYYARFRDGDDRGRPVATGQTTLGAATTWAAAELRHRELAARPPAPTLGDWLKPFWGPKCPYCSRREEEGHAIGHAHRTAMRRRIERFVDGTPLAAIRLDAVRRDDLLRLRTRVAQEAGKASANLAMIAVRIPIKEAVFRGLIGADPTSGIGKMRGAGRTKGILTPAELSALLKPEAWDGPQEHLAFCVAAMTGMRTGEIRALCWGQLDFERRRIAVTRAIKAWTNESGPPKSGKPRTAPMPKPLEDALLAALAQHLVPPGASDLVLPAAGGGPRGSGWLRLAMADACRGLGIDAKARGIAPHSIRATVATWLVDAGADRRKIMSALGWADEAVMNRHYVHEEELNLDGLSTALEALPAP